MLSEMELTLEQTQQGASHEVSNIRVNYHTEDGNLLGVNIKQAHAGNPVKKILLKLNLSDHRLCKMVVECQSVKVKNFKKDATLKLFKNGMSMLVQKSQVHKMAKEGEIDIDIFQIEDEILREKLLNVNLLINNIEALNLTPSIPFVVEYPSSSPISIVDRDIIFSNDLLNDDPIFEYEHFTFDIEPNAPVINNFDELNEDECFDLGGSEIHVSQNIEDDDSFAFVIRTFLSYRTYLVDSPLFLSTGSEDTIFYLDIST
ncbi:hypothetical protein Tco_1456061 [Tanacetum coccineum]